MFLRRFTYAVFFSLMVLVGCRNDDFTSRQNAPSISEVRPSQVTRGQQGVKAEIIGNNFHGLVAVNMGEGVTVDHTSIQSPTTLAVTFSVEPDASTGPRDITIRTSWGVVHDSRVFSINDNTLPVARFSVTPSQGRKDTRFLFDSSASSDSDGTVQAYAWDFGDGATASGKTVKHTYASTGEFDVTLTVTDNEHGEGTATQNLTVSNNSPPSAYFSVLPETGDTTTVFSFDGSDSIDADGRITRYAWDFQEGHTDEGKRVSHKFLQKGTYSVTLTVTDSEGSQSSVAKDVHVSGVLPIADFLVTPSSGPKTTKFHFDASASRDPDGKIDNYTWDFRDGTPKHGQVVQHQFSADGDYPVRLTVTDNDGSTSSTEATVRVGGGGNAPTCPDSERIYVNDGGLKPFCDSWKLPTTSGPDHPVTVTGVYEKNQHRVMDIRVYNGDGNQDYCCYNMFHLCTEFRDTSGTYVFGASGFEIGPYGHDGSGYYRDYYLYRGGAETFGGWPPVVGQILYAHFVQCE